MWAGGRTLANYSIKVFRASKKALGILVPRVGLHVLLKVQPLGQLGEVGVHDFEVFHFILPFFLFWFGNPSGPSATCLWALPFGLGFRRSPGSLPLSDYSIAQATGLVKYFFSKKIKKFLIEKCGYPVSLLGRFQIYPDRLSGKPRFLIIKKRTFSSPLNTFLPVHSRRSKPLFPNQQGRHSRAWRAWCG